MKKSPAKKMFECADCHKTKRPAEGSCLTGYATDAQGRKICFDCCNTRDRVTMLTKKCADSLPLYLTIEMYHNAAKRAEIGVWFTGKVTNWPGTLEITCTGKVGGHNIAGYRFDVWFEFNDHEWHGVQYGNMSQIVRQCKQTQRRI